jgi:hypothetical protein
MLFVSITELTASFSSTEWPSSITAVSRADHLDTRPGFAELLAHIASNFVGCSTGSSPAFAPRRILSTYSPARRNKSGIESHCGCRTEHEPEFIGPKAAPRKKGRQERRGRTERTEGRPQIRKNFKPFVAPTFKFV